MDSLLLLVATFLGYILMYRLYGRYLSRKIFQIDPDLPVPSKTFEDGVDYVPTKKGIVFGHHFTSIAGTGPIVGPAIAVIWGWLPAMLWVFLGSIFMGAVHDFGSLLISLRNQGKSISDYTSRYINNKARSLFFLVVFLELWIVIAVFGLIIALIFNMFPDSVFPVWMQIIIAVGLGRAVKRGKNVMLWSVVSVVFMYVSVIAGTWLPFTMPDIAGFPATGVWTIILLIYAFVASVLPVGVLLQPRDYINAFQLVIALALMVVGVLVVSFTRGLPLVAPAIDMSPKGAPDMIPALFIIIACGAISGFHSLVSSGTSAKQISSEGDTLFVGYGAMITESILATLVLIAVAAGIGLGFEENGQTFTGIAAWTTHYSSWAALEGLGSKLSAFIGGSSNILGGIGIPQSWAVALMGVFVASFAGTTLDTAARIQRYIVSELFHRVKLFQNTWFATFVAVGSSAVLAFVTGADGKGALSLWPLFGAVNQVLAALALVVITIYLRQQGGKKWIVSGIPALFMVLMTLWATILAEHEYIKQGNWLLAFINLVIIFAVFLVVFEGIKKFFETSLDSTLPDLKN